MNYILTEEEPGTVALYHYQGKDWWKQLAIRSRGKWFRCVIDMRLCGRPEEMEEPEFRKISEEEAAMIMFEVE